MTLHLSRLDREEQATAERADLPDVLRMVATLATTHRMGAEFRASSLRLADAGHDLEHMSGLVIDGEVYGVQHKQEWAVCRCGDGKHRFNRDSTYARGYWHETRRDADEMLARAVKRWAEWEPKSPEPHLTTRLWATTGTEVVR